MMIILLKTVLEHTMSVLIKQLKVCFNRVNSQIEHVVIQYNKGIYSSFQCANIEKKIG